CSEHDRGRLRAHNGSPCRAGSWAIRAYAGNLPDRSVRVMKFAGRVALAEMRDQQPIAAKDDVVETASQPGDERQQRSSGRPIEYRAVMGYRVQIPVRLG